MMRHPCRRGFTLLELLVVIIIIGILAAVAIPLYLNQRQKGYDSAAKSDLHNLASFEEVYLSDWSVYGSGAQLLAATGTQGIHASNADVLTVVSYEGVKGYCLSAKSNNSPNTWFWDSNNGGLQPKGTTACPTSYATVDGSVIP